MTDTGLRPPPDGDRARAPDDRRPEPDDHDPPPPGVRAMAVVRWALIAVMALIAVAALEHRYDWWSDGDRAGGSTTVYYCPMHPGVQQDHPGDCPICSMTLVPRPAAGDGGGEAAARAAMTTATTATAAPAGPGAYYCPMHPEVTSDDPDARCAPCGGMKLLPRPAAGDAGPGGGVAGLVPVTLTPERVQLMGMRTAVVSRQPMAAELRAVGSVATAETGLAVIQTRFAGWIEDLRVEQTGQRVTRGQVLATVYSPELLAAQQEHLDAVRWGTAPDGGPLAGLSSGLAADSRLRLELLGVAAGDIATLERTGTPIRAVAVRSPLTGHVIDKNVVQGSYLAPGTSLFQIADLSRVWVIADVHEHEIPRVAVGQPARFEMGTHGGERFTGKVTFIHPALDAGTRTLRIRLELANPGLRLKPGMYGNVVIQLSRAEALVVPAEAVVDTGATQYVFLARAGGRFEPRAVTVGARSGGLVELRGGVVAGDVVVTTGNFLLDSESHLQATVVGAGTAAAP